MLAFLHNIPLMREIRRHGYPFHITTCYVQYLCLYTFTMKKTVQRKATLTLIVLMWRIG